MSRRASRDVAGKPEKPGAGDSADVVHTQVGSGRAEVLGLTHRLCTGAAPTEYATSYTGPKDKSGTAS